MLTLCFAAFPLGTQARAINVFAASSLKEAFTKIAQTYETQHPGITIKLNLAGSQTLAAQINLGAPADLFASASVMKLNQIHYDKSTYHVFAKNKLDIALKKGSTGIKSIADLDKIQNLVIADPSVPVGAYTEAFLTRAELKFGAPWLARIRSHIVSRETDVKAVLAKVNLGEADAGLVYASDIRTNRDQAGEMPIPDRFNQISEYPAAVPDTASDPQDARQFIRFLLSPLAQRILEKSGFISVARPSGHNRS